MPFPLLFKELAEQAARRRTFALRALYALILFTVFIVAYLRHPPDSGDSGFGSMLGQGRGMVGDLVTAQCWLIYLVMPVLAAGAITAERESGTLVLLMLTDLGPWELLLQKWLSRIIAMGSLVLVSLPLMALAYAFGGCGIEYLECGILTLVLTVLQAAAIAIAMSCVLRTSTGALIATYAALAACVLVSGHWLERNYNWYYYQRLGSGGSLLTSLQPLRLFELVNDYTHYRLDFCVASSAMVLLSMLAALAVARVFILRQAQPVGMSPLLRLFRRLDHWFERADAAIGRGQGQPHLPGRDPVASREFNRRSFSNWRYLMRLILPLHVLVLVAFLGVISIGIVGYGHIRIQPVAAYDAELGGMTVFLMILASGIFARERGDQALDVLLTTPMTGREILAQKVRSLRRIHIAFSSFPAVLLGCAWLFGAATGTSTACDAMFILFTLVILPGLFVWLAVWVGLEVRNRLRAATCVLLIFILWLGGGMILQEVEWEISLFDRFGHWDARGDAGAWLWQCLLSPYVALNACVYGDMRAVPRGLPISLLWYAGLALLLRWHCLRVADRVLRRSSR